MIIQTHYKTMKKILAIVALSAAVAVSANAQSSILGNLGNIVSGLGNVVYSGPVSLNGTYTYNGIAVSVSSNEGGILTNLAGSTVTSGIEAKIDGILAKVGIKPGAMSVVFNSSEGTFVWTVGNIPLSGTYKVGDGEKTVTLTFGKNMQYFSMTGTLESTLDGARMLFTSEKATTFLKKVVSKLGQSGGEIGSIAKLAEGYDNYKVGFKFTK